jgi:polar amino acid transport system substrate-binding protein
MRGLVLLAVVAFVLASPSVQPRANAQNQAPSHIVAGVPEVYAASTPPFSYFDDLGVAQGISVDILLEMSRLVGYPLRREDIRYVAWPRAVANTRSHPGAILLTPARTPGREGDFTWIGPVHSLRLGLIAKKSKHIRIAGAADFQGLRISSIRNSAPIHYLNVRYGLTENDLTIVTNDEQQMSMLERERVDLITHGDFAAAFHANKLGMNPADFEMVDVLQMLDLYIAFNPETDPELLRRMREAFTALHAPRADGGSLYKDILARHLDGGGIAVVCQP